jgi:hypothetical protein
MSLRNFVLVFMPHTLKLHKTSCIMKLSFLPLIELLESR